MTTTAQAKSNAPSIQYVKGVGPRRAQQLGALGITTVRDLCLHAPRRYEDRAHFAAIADLRPGQAATVRGRLLSKQLRRIRGGRSIVEIAVGDATGVVYGVWFNQPYLAQQLTVDEELLLYGQVEPRARRLARAS